MANENPKAKTAESGATATPDVAALQTQVQELSAMVSALLRAQGQVSPDTIWAKQQQKEIALEAAHAAIAKYGELTTQHRSQLETNKLFSTGAKLWKVLLGSGKDGEWPELVIKADLEADAKARYQVACGILYVRIEPEHPEWSKWTLQDVTNDAAAQAAVKETWTYQPAA